MALPRTEKVLFRIPNGSGELDEVLVDVCTGEQHTLTNTLTDHPVEEGAPITDHSRPEPRRLQLECIQSNTPLGEEVDGANRAAELWQRFVDLHEHPQLIEVQTVRDYYRSMGIESVSSPVDVKSAQALRFTISLKTIHIVQNRLTRVVTAADPRAHGKRKQGGVMTFTLDETDPDRRNVSSAFKVAGLEVQ